MITAEFLRKRTGELCGFVVSGHAGFDDPGRDIVCAAVSSAVQLTANLLTEVFSWPGAEVNAENNKVSVVVPDKDCDEEIPGGIIGGFQLHMQLLSEEFEGTIKIVYTEV